MNKNEYKWEGGDGEGQRYIIKCAGQRMSASEVVEMLKQRERLIATLEGNSKKGAQVIIDG